MDMTRFLSLNLYWKKDQGVYQIGNEPCDEEWQQYAAQTLEEHKDADNDDTEYDTSDKTVECNLFTFHNALFLVLCLILQVLFLGSYRELEADSPAVSLLFGLPE